MLDQKRWVGYAGTMLERPVLKARLTDPCPCGSGRKYKRCCWATSKREFAVALAEIHKAPADLAEFVFTRFPGLAEEVLGDFLTMAAEQLGVQTIEDVVEELGETLKSYVFEASLLDVPVEDGRTGLQLYLSDPASAGLRSTTREYLEALSHSAYSVYEVEDLQEKELIFVKDLLRRRKLTVLDRSSSDALSRYQIYFARVVEMESLCLFSNILLPIPRRHLENILEMLRDFKVLMRAKSLGWIRFLSREWELPLMLWLWMLARAATPAVLTNTDGDPLFEIDLAFEIGTGKGPELRRRFDDSPEMERDGESEWLILGPGEGMFENGVLRARFEIDGDKLRVRVNSEKREAEARRLLNRLASDCLGELSRKAVEIDPEYLREREAEAPEIRGGESQIPPDIEEQILGDALERHYRAWVDHALPILDGLTPREAAAQPRMRSRIVSVLKDVELHHARAQDAMGAYDPSWLWAELGLPRP